MSNTVILLVVLGVINFLIKKFAAKPATPQSMADEQLGARQSQPSVTISAQASAEIAARKFADQARALGLIDENGNAISSRRPVMPAAPDAAKIKPMKTQRVTQKPIGVTDFAPKAPVIARNRTASSTVSPAVALSGSVQSAIVSQITQSQTPQKPISAIDALIASRLSQRIAPMTQPGHAAKPKAIWNAKSMRQGLIMAEILSPPIALRS